MIKGERKNRTVKGDLNSVYLIL